MGWKWGNTLILNPSPVREKEDRGKARLVGSERVSGVWVRARKLEGELDVGGRRIVCPTGESIVVTAEPAWFWTDT